MLTTYILDQKDFFALLYYFKTQKLFHNEDKIGILPRGFNDQTTCIPLEDKQIDAVFTLRNTGTDDVSNLHMKSLVNC